MIKRIGLLIVFVTAVLLTTAFTYRLVTITGEATVAFGFLIIVLLSAYFGDIFIAIASSVVATLCFDYFYLQPFGTLKINDFADWIALAAFLIASVVISRLTASAAENASKATLLDGTMTRLSLFGDWIMRRSHDQITLTAIAQEVLRLFSLEYCSIHVYCEGKWSHYSGTAHPSDDYQSIESKLEDHPSDFINLASENLLGVRYKEIVEGSTRKALLVVKSATLPDSAIGAIAYMLSLRLPQLRDVHDGDN